MVLSTVMLAVRVMAHAHCTRSGTICFYYAMYCSHYTGTGNHCYRPQRSCGKVMFLHGSVILLKGGVCPIACWDTHPSRTKSRAPGTKGRQTPPGTKGRQPPPPGPKADPPGRRLLLRTVCTQSLILSCHCLSTLSTTINVRWVGKAPCLHLTKSTESVDVTSVLGRRCT